MEHQSTRRAAARRSRRAGITMIEVLISVIVIVVAFGGAVMSQLTANDLQHTARETTLAMADLQACLEQVLLLPSEDLPIEGSLFASGEPVAAFQDRNLQNEIVVVTYPDYVDGAAVPDPLQIVVTVTWDDFDGRPRQLQLSTAKTR